MSIRTTLITLLTTLLAASAVLAQDAAFENAQDRISYALGMDIGRNMKLQEMDINPAVFAQGMGDAMGDGETKLTEDEARETLMSFQVEMQQKMAERHERDAVENKEKSDAFLAENKAKDGVTVTASGLQYEVITEGEGDVKPSANDRVKVDYTGKLLDDTVFDSSVERGQPAIFPVNRVIPGWTEALQLMTVGSKWKLVIPSELAYGERGAPPRIGPNSVLQFEVELLEIMEPPQTPFPHAGMPKVSAPVAPPPTAPANVE